jgi:hypothetical protein
MLSTQTKLSAESRPKCTPEMLLQDRKPSGSARSTEDGGYHFSSFEQREKADSSPTKSREFDSNASVRE